MTFSTLSLFAEYANLDRRKIGYWLKRGLTPSEILRKFSNETVLINKG